MKEAFVRSFFGHQHALPLPHIRLDVLLLLNGKRRKGRKERKEKKGKEGKERKEKGREGRKGKGRKGKGREEEESMQ